MDTEPTIIEKQKEISGEKNTVNPEKRPRVLIADDEANIRRILLFILKKEFDVTAVESGEKALEMIRRGEDFDVVSLDIHMPGMNGIDTLEAIKSENPSTEVLLLTAHSNVEYARKALKLGAYDYIDKPFDKEGLRAAIRNGVERRNKTLELEKAQQNLAFVKAQLRQSEKFAAIGESIAGFVHELNNPLGAIMGFSELLMMDKCSPEQVIDYIHQINEGVKICKSITEKFLCFARKKEPKREPVQMNKIVESTLELKQHDFKKDAIHVVKNLDDSLPETTADYHAIQQVFLNILNNAQHAMMDQTHQKKITIRSEFDDQWIRLRFQDTGEGIPIENIEKIFEPLFTTKEEGKGTGLGLSLCYEIIKEHHGNIYVASEPGKGACFVIEIPIADKVRESKKVGESV